MKNNFINVQDRLINKDNIVLIEILELDSFKYRAKLLLKGEFSIEIDYENFTSLSFDLHTIESLGFTTLKEFDFQDKIISTYYINKKYLSGIAFSTQEYENKNYVIASLLLTECIEEPYPILTNFKSISEGAGYFGL